jgi:hypothetical protein
MADNSKLRMPTEQHFGMRMSALATDTRASGTPHDVPNGGAQAVPNSDVSSS